MLHIVIQACKWYFTPETMLDIAFHSHLSVECSFMVFQSVHALFLSKKVLSSINVLFVIIVSNSL